MKKQKGDMITFFIMTFLASFMLFVCLNLLTGTFRVIDTNKETINGADALIFKTEEPVSDFKLKELIQANENFDGYEENKYLGATAKYRKKGAKSWSDYWFYFVSYEEERSIHTSSIDLSGFSGNEIVLPVSLSASYKLGDTIEIKIDENIYEFTVAGFNEDFIFASPMNMSTYLVYVSEKMYQQIEFENANYVTPSIMIKSKLSAKAIRRNASGQEVLDNVATEWSTWHQNYRAMHPEYTEEVSGNFIPSELMTVASMILPFMFIAIILVFAVIVFVVALVVIDFSVKNFIMDNMRNTGIMEAGGYTVKEMMFILLVQLLSVSLGGSLLGTVLGALLQKKIGFIMLFLLGLSWNQKPDWLVFAGVVAGICIIITLFTLLLGRQYKKTTVLDALRGGINTHNYKKNVFPFDRTNLPVLLTLSLKETFGKFTSQIGVIFIMAILAFAGAMGFGIYENMGRDVDSLLRISGLEIYDADFVGDANMEETVKGFEIVDSIHHEVWMGFDFQKGKKTKNYSTRVISDTSVMRPEQMVEGRWPKYENEVALGTSAANNLGLKIGDTVTVKNGENEAQYLVCGIMQTFNNMGQMAYLSEEGYERIGNMPKYFSVNVTLKKGYKYQDLEKEFKAVYPDTDLTDEYASTGGLFSMLKISMASILLIIMIVTAFVVGLAEALLIRTRITKEWRNLGVNKALGFSSNQIIGQLMLSNIPAILIGIVIGLVAVTLFGDKLVLLMFAIFGFRKVVFDLSLFSYLCVIIVIVGVALIVSWFNGKRIRELEPVKMITEE
ncbi:MAG: ABC transporter permease [Lachnospiraceae bacterium]|nr:ABC transporter permease [Lachnospiraceae bacterium]